MTSPFLGEVQIFGFNFAPRDWASCNGSQLPIRQYTALYSLIGTIYGGDGQTIFLLPNLVVRAGSSQGAGPGLTPRSAGESVGENGVMLSQQEMPVHAHSMTAYSGGADRAGTPAAGAGLGAASRVSLYAAAGTAPDTTFSPTTVAVSGAGAPHENRQPFLALNFSIALSGIFPSFG